MKNNIGKRPAGRGRSQWLWALGVMVFLGVGAWGLWGQRPPPPPPKPAIPAQPPRMEGLSLTEIHEGDKTWVLEAKRRISTRTSDHQHQRCPSGIFGPGEDIRVKAEAGLFKTKTRVLTLTGGWR